MEADFDKENLLRYCPKQKTLYTLSRTGKMFEVFVVHNDRLHNITSLAMRVCKRKGMRFRVTGSGFNFGRSVVEEISAALYGEDCLNWESI